MSTMSEEKEQLTPDEFIAANESKVNKRWYPRFHIAPRVGWCNDPNGFAYAGGKYHLFYQYYPYEPKWGPMHWAHVTSKDLVHWQRQPVALFPDHPYDADGCFSGSGIEKDGKLYLLYTGHVDLLKKPGQPDRIETQALAVSVDGVHFEKSEKNPVITLPESVSTGEDHHSAIRRYGSTMAATTRSLAHRRPTRWARYLSLSRRTLRTGSSSMSWLRRTAIRASCGSARTSRSSTATRL